MAVRTDRPLVSIAVMTYCQEKYVRDAVRGLLAQTYEPLEIVISDDCSRDGTWAAIEEEVARYRQAGGLHTRIVLNRNEKNLGIALHAKKMLSMCRGDILVACGGDDISEPNRVERIVEVWREASEPVTCVLSGLVQIDEMGRVIGTDEKMWIDEENPLGAVIAYDRRVVENFPAVTHHDAHEDAIFVRRARMLGEVVKIPDRLVRYRNVGVCSGWEKKGFRAFREKACHCALEGLLQVLDDLEYMRPRLSEDKYRKLKEKYSQTERCLRAEQAVLSGPTLLQRLIRSKAYMELAYGSFRPLSVGYLRAVLPRVLSKRSFDLVMIPLRTARAVGRLLRG